MRREGIAVPGFKLDKTGKLVRSGKGLSVSKRLAQRKRRKTRVVARRRFGA